MKPRRLGILNDCCADELIVIHNYKDAEDRLLYKEFEKTMHANPKVPARVPTKPQCFFYDEEAMRKYPHDAHRNVAGPKRNRTGKQTFFTRLGELECAPPDLSEFEPAGKLRHAPRTG